MKLLVLSDLHLEFADFEVAADVDFDVAILAGDISNPGSASVDWAQRSAALRDKPVILVPGNHEFYRTRMDRALQEMRASAAGSDVHVLDGDEWMCNGVRFLGATLWTDFALRIQTTQGPQSIPARGATATEMALSDYRLIKLPLEGAPSGTAEEMIGRPLRARDTLQIHQTQRRWLETQMAEPFSGPTVVITHHGPHAQSVAARYAADWVSAGFSSELPERFFQVPVLWIHGHTHDSFDYRVGGCRVLCNPRGYVNRWSGQIENRNFDSGLVVEVEP